MANPDKFYVVSSEDVRGYADLAALSIINIAVWEADQNREDFGAKLSELELKVINARKASDDALYEDGSTISRFAVANQAYREAQREFLFYKYKLDNRTNVKIASPHDAWAEIGKAMAYEYFSNFKTSGRPKKNILRSQGQYRFSSLRKTDSFLLILSRSLNDLIEGRDSFPVKARVPRPYTDSGLKT